MKKSLMVIMLFLGAVTLSSAQGKFKGVWQSVDDEDGKPKSHLEIFEEKGELKVKVIKLLPSAKTKICTECTGALKNKPIEGMLLVNGMKKINDKEYDDGEILNPKNGKIYSCSMTMMDDNKIKVRGYIGFSLIGKTQYWTRVK